MSKAQQQMKRNAVPQVHEYCGCCGREKRGEDENFCVQCLEHVATEGKPWQRTFHYQHGTHCPHQVPELKVEEFGLPPV